MAPVKYKIIKNFFSKEELKIYQKYCYNKLDEANYGFDPQSFSPRWHHDSLITSILDNKLSLIESESKLKLYPTYAYWRYYVFGGNLKQHTDRSACEISVTACIKKYDNWPLIIEGKTIELKEGEGLLYSGCEHKHGRPGIYKGEGIAQVFLHYVNQNGPNKNYAYDKKIK
tara:strand:+ start:514 stop:1026 length:513 start_codon:yes stop_codon:yes gene_type:complete